MKAWAPADDDAKFELTPMIDVVFLLIAFFMTVTTFSSAELVKIEMPKAGEAKVPENNSGRQFVSIDKFGNYFLGSRPSDLETIKAAVSKRVEEGGDNFRGVYLRADMETPHKYVSDVMKACAEVGSYNIIFGTLQQ